MDIKELLSSGIIEMYCMGMTSEEESRLVEYYAGSNQVVRDEIASVNEALQLYARASGKSPAASLKKKILKAVVDGKKKKELEFPPRITLETKAEEWLHY